MTSPNQYPDPVSEEVLRKSREVFGLMADIAYSSPIGVDGAGNAHWTAFEQIKGIDLATLYLRGAADYLTRCIEETPLSLRHPNSNEDPRDTVVKAIWFMAERKERENRGITARDRIQSSMQPWLDARSRLAGESS